MNGRLVIGICSAGSGIGQAAINACRLSALPVSTVGLGNNELAFGIYECDQFYTIPSYYRPGYVWRFCEVCDSYGIDLLIPGHDDEALVLSRNAASFAALGVQVLASSPELIEICRREEALRDAFPEAQELFCKSYTRAELLGAADSTSVQYPLVAKLRSGFGSRGVLIIRSAAEVAALNPDLIFQEIAVPARSDPHH